MNTAIRKKEQVSLAQEISEIVHQLRNPLAGVQGAVQILRDRLRHAPEQAILDEALTRLADMNTLLGGLLRRARLESAGESGVRRWLEITDDAADAPEGPR